MLIQEPDYLVTFFRFFHMCDLGVFFTFHFRKIITELSVIFLQNGVLILNWKENKEAGAICFEIRIPRKKNKELLRKVPSKIYGSYFIMEKNKNIFWFVNNSEYHHREMGLLSFQNRIFSKMKLSISLEENYLGNQTCSSEYQFKNEIADWNIRKM